MQSLYEQVLIYIVKMKKRKKKQAKQGKIREGNNERKESQALKIKVVMSC
jgi:hypothetical protein